MCPKGALSLRKRAGARRRRGRARRRQPRLRRRLRTACSPCPPNASPCRLLLQPSLAGSSYAVQRQGAALHLGGEQQSGGAADVNGTSMSGSGTGMGSSGMALRSQVGCHEVKNKVSARELDLQQQRRCALAAARGSPPGGYVAACLAVKSARAGQGGCGPADGKQNAAQVALDALMCPPAVSIGSARAAAPIHLRRCMSPPPADQHRDLAEWLGWHARLGVARVYVMDAGSQPPLHALLAPYVQVGAAGPAGHSSQCMLASCARGCACNAPAALHAGDACSPSPAVARRLRRRAWWCTAWWETCRRCRPT